MDSVESGKLLAGAGTAQRKVAQADLHVAEQSIVTLCRPWLPSFLREQSHRSSSWCNGNGKKALIELIEKERLKIKIKSSSELLSEQVGRANLGSLKKAVKGP